MLLWLGSAFGDVRRHGCSERVKSIAISGRTSYVQERIVNERPPETIKSQQQRQQQPVSKDIAPPLRDDENRPRKKKATKRNL